MVIKSAKIHGIDLVLISFAVRITNGRLNVHSTNPTTIRKPRLVSKAIWARAIKLQRKRLVSINNITRKQSLRMKRPCCQLGQSETLAFAAHLVYIKGLYYTDGVTRLEGHVDSQSEKNRDEDSGFERLAGDNEENWNGELILEMGKREALGDLRHNTNFSGM